jgi:probable FeS assembly SUF system protein SufT
MATNEKVTLDRDCAGVELASSRKVTLEAGSQVTVVQVTPDSVTVKTGAGELVRLPADGIGGGQQGAAAHDEVRAALELQVWEQLRTCYDPEIPLNIVDLGLVYGCQVTPVEEGGHRVDVTMTLTAPGCGMSEYLTMEVQAKLSTIPGVTEAKVELVWDPPWNHGLLSEAAKLKLGLL